jgi:hypothetical protein
LGISLLQSHCVGNCALLVQPNRILYLCTALITGIKAKLPINHKRLREATDFFDEVVGLTNKALNWAKPGTHLLQMLLLSGNRADLDGAISALEKGENDLSCAVRDRVKVASNFI